MCLKPAPGLPEPVASMAGDSSACELLPSHIPRRPASLFKAAGSGGRRRRESRASVRRAAWLLAEFQLSTLNFLTGGCPTGIASITRRLGLFHVSGVQAQAFENLVAANLAFGRLAGAAPAPLSRGLERFENLLSDFEIRWAPKAAHPTRGRAALDVTVAMPVDPNRVQVPETAGVLDPAQVLPEPMRTVFLDASARVRPHWDNVKPHRFCFRVSADDEHELRCRFLKSGMAELIRDDQVPRYQCGRPLLAGMFTAPHKEKVD